MSCRASPPGDAVIGNVTRAPCAGSGSNATFSFTNYPTTIQGATLEYWIVIALGEYEYGKYTIEPHDLAYTFADRGDPGSIYQLYIGPQNFTVDSVAIA